LFPNERFLVHLPLLLLHIAIADGLAFLLTSLAVVARQVEIRDDALPG
jgi:hypothetical protein